MLVFIVRKVFYRSTSGVFIHNDIEIDTFGLKDEENIEVVLRSSGPQKSSDKRQPSGIVKERKLYLAAKV